MKQILALLIFCSIGFISFGQQKIIPKSFKVDTAYFNNIKHFQVNRFNQPFTSNIKILPLDNMPCLVTNEKLIAAIPNAVVKIDAIDNMPNALKKN
jgi:hypothetical protein